MSELLIPYGGGVSDGAELQYSLRSIEANLHDAHRAATGSHHLTLVGALPGWLDPHSPHLTYVPWANTLPTPSQNTCRAVALGCDSLIGRGVTEALYCDDDYFLFWPVPGVLPVTLGRLATAHRGWGTDYEGRVRNTMRRLHPDARSFEAHTPLPVDVHRLRAVMVELDGVDEPVLWRSLYGNRVGITAYPIGGDGRFGSNRGSFARGVPWQSSEDRAWATWAGRAIAERFPAPSIWELP